MPRARSPPRGSRGGATETSRPRTVSVGALDRRAGADELVHHAEPAVDLHAALVGSQLAADDAQQRRLARAVRADERGRRAPPSRGRRGRPAAAGRRQREGDAVDVDEAHGRSVRSRGIRRGAPMGSRPDYRAAHAVATLQRVLRQAGVMQRIAAEPLDVLRTRTSEKWRQLSRRRAAAARRRDGLPARRADQRGAARGRRPLRHRLLGGQPPGRRGVPGLRRRPASAGMSTRRG